MDRDDLEVPATILRHVVYQPTDRFQIHGKYELAPNVPLSAIRLHKTIDGHFSTTPFLESHVIMEKWIESSNDERWQTPLGSALWVPNWNKLVELRLMTVAIRDIVIRDSVVYLEFPMAPIIDKFDGYLGFLVRINDLILYVNR